VDIAVHNEMAQGRNVYMDFTRNPVADQGLEHFSLENLEPEARQYLERSGALQDTPFDRLAHMNPLAIDIYTEHGVDLRRPLEVAVCSQHCNGGLTVDVWWRTTVPGLFAIGEVAGTHGVRPGGSALNSGQVGGLRAAQLISHQSRNADADTVGDAPDLTAQIAAETAELRLYRSPSADAPSVDEVRAEIQDRSSDAAGFIRSSEGVSTALEQAEALALRIGTQGQRLASDQQVVMAFQNEHLCRTQIAFLTAIRALLRRGGGSRGAYVVLDDAGDRQMPTAAGQRMPHRSENLAMREEIVEVAANAAGEYDAFITPVRPLPTDDSWYESTWRQWRDGDVFDD